MTEAPPKTVSRAKASIVVGLMFAMFLIPYFYVIYIYKTGEIPTVKTNEKGTFFKPFIKLSEHELLELNEENWSISKIEGKWVIMNFATRTCEQACLERIFNTEQAIVALTKDEGRVDQLVVINPELEISNDLKTIINLRKYVYPVRNQSLFDAVAQQVFSSEENSDQDLSGYIAIVDPESQLLLWYSPDQSITEILRDIKRLLKSSVSSYSSQTENP